MKTLVRALGFTGAGAIGLAALSFASPASAVTVAGCGDEPVGATLTNTSGVCELDFATAGGFSWTVPTDITSLYAVLVGGGGGAYFSGNNGYAGSGGVVNYSDYSSIAAGTTATVTVGAGGSSTAVGTGSTGGTTSVDFGTSVSAMGGIGSEDFMSNYCLPGGTSFSLVGPGDGAGGAAVNADGGNCAVAYGPSVNPSTDVDSASAPALAAFSSLDTEFGAGGTVEIAPDALPSASDLIGTGNGASVLVAASLSSVTSADATGGSGRVVFRFTTETSADSGGGEGDSGSGTDAASDAALAKTGTDVLAPVALLSALGIAGVALLALARRRRTATAATAAASSTKN
jgi:hypothetical protein